MKILHVILSIDFYGQPEKEAFISAPSDKTRALVQDHTQLSSDAFLYYEDVLMYIHKLSTGDVLSIPDKLVWFLKKVIRRQSTRVVAILKSSNDTTHFVSLTLTDLRKLREGFIRFDAGEYNREV